VPIQTTIDFVKNTILDCDGKDCHVYNVGLQPTVPHRLRLDRIVVLASSLLTIVLSVTTTRSGKDGLSLKKKKSSEMRYSSFRNDKPDQN